jgi:hypothetical protein
MFRIMFISIRWRKYMDLETWRRRTEQGNSTRLFICVISLRRSTDYWSYETSNEIRMITNENKQHVYWSFYGRFHHDMYDAWL